MNKIITLCVMYFVVGHAVAAGPNWAYADGHQNNNGAISVKGVSGATSYSAVQNPTGAVAKTNQNAVTAPPVIIQATASMPFVDINDACVVATDTAAIWKQDNRTLLTCENSKWVPSRAVYAVDGDTCNIIYKALPIQASNKITLASALPTGSTASDSNGLLLSCQSGGKWGKVESRGRIVYFIVYGWTHQNQTANVGAYVQYFDPNTGVMSQVTGGSVAGAMGQKTNVPSFQWDGSNVWITMFNTVKFNSPWPFQYKGFRFCTNANPYWANDVIATYPPGANLASYYSFNSSGGYFEIGRRTLKMDTYVWDQQLVGDNASTAQYWYVQKSLACYE